ncbi:hypothetical protein D1013_15005 [Euzebyella marina]|uniref:Uncharacterized protein n=1 Tax=Euzebyella marina TaxID=1761453 RepID=A0A3G2L8L3_9FLAO|nr:hypothetical protein [Euzebyella marina]AYN68590.1 hypothetical protein D1013_15005 [Euzebyella marina]
MVYVVRAIYKENSITTLVRNSRDIDADIIFRLLGAERFFESEKDNVNEMLVERSVLEEALSLMENYRHYKETDFLETCIEYFIRLPISAKISLVFVKRGSFNGSL